MRMKDIVEKGGKIVEDEREKEIGRERFIVRGIVEDEVMFGNKEEEGKEIGEMRVVFERKIE